MKSENDSCVQWYEALKSVLQLQRCFLTKKPGQAMQILAPFLLVLRYQSDIAGTWFCNFTKLLPRSIQLAKVSPLDNILKFAAHKLTQCKNKSSQGLFLLSSLFSCFHFDSRWMTGPFYFITAVGLRRFICRAISARAIRFDWSHRKCHHTMAIQSKGTCNIQAQGRYIGYWH